MFRSKDVSKWTETFKDVVTANYLVHVLHCPEGHLNIVSLHDCRQDVVLGKVVNKLEKLLSGASFSCSSYSGVTACLRVVLQFEVVATVSEGLLVQGDSRAEHGRRADCHLA